MGIPTKIVSDAESRAIRENFSTQENSSPSNDERFQTTSALRRTADSLIANVSAMQTAINRIETLEIQVFAAKTAYQDARQNMIGAGLNSDVYLLDNAFDL